MNPVTQVDGLAVVTYEAGAAMAWLGQRANGEVARTTMANTLTLADGSQRYQCAIQEGCDFVAATVQAVTAGHGPKAHGSGNGGRGRSRVLATKENLLDMSLREFIAFVGRNEELLSRAEDWRDRALAAERRLAGIERQFQ